MLRNVLFVDDDQIMLLALQKRLAKYNDTFSIILAEDGFDAVRKLKENPVSLVVLDLKMPRMDGVSLLSHLSGNYPDIPVIVISGYRTDEMRRLASEKEVLAYISKPFQLDDLAKVVLGALRREAEGGTLHNVSPVVFLQLMEMESRTCTIRVIDGGTGKGGVLFFKEGGLYDARVDQIKGIDAAYIIFTWENVTLFIHNECQVNVNVINSTLQPIIMKAVEMKDEQGAEIPENEEAPESLAFEDVRIENLSPQQGEKSGAALMKEPAIERIRNLLQREIGEKSGVESIAHDDQVDDVVHSMSELGMMFNFGSLKVGYVDRGMESDEVIVPGAPSIVIKVSRKCPQDKILEVLRTRL
ncbi:MAG: response regulator [Desulfocapsaceae bacterium]|nr:response regulator [Desulfocapsaceae bacterium]